MFKDLDGNNCDIKDIAFRADVDEKAQTVSIFILAEMGDHKASVVDMVMEATAEGQAVNPVADISVKQAEELMADLWHCGVRPSGVDLSDQRELKATKEHLKDARMMMVALWNKLNGAPSSIGPMRPQKPLVIKDPPTGSGGSRIETPEGPEMDKNVGKVDDVPAK